MRNAFVYLLLSQVGVVRSGSHGFFSWLHHCFFLQGHHRGPVSQDTLIRIRFHRAPGLSVHVWEKSGVRLGLVFVHRLEMWTRIVQEFFVVQLSFKSAPSILWLLLDGFKFRWDGFHWDFLDCRGEKLFLFESSNCTCYYRCVRCSRLS